MPKTKISEYSTTNSDNTDIESINIAEGCAPSGINNAIRELMVHLKEFQTGSSGDPLTVAGGFVASGGMSANTMTVTGILTASGGTIMSGTNTMSGGNILSGTNTISGAAIISGNINSSGTTNTFSGGNIFSGTNTISGSAIISGNINSSGTNTFSGSNVMSFGGGTSASPSIYFASDTNTGVFSPAADTIAAATGGTERLRIDSSGYVGIGRTPSYLLDVNSTARFNSTIAVGGATPAASGAGVSFPATQSASSDANTLDDYEEGTWTGTLKGSTTDPTTPVTKTGYYTKIGRTVTCVIEFVDINNTGAAGLVTVTGLPFTCFSSAHCMGSCGTYSFTFTNSSTSAFAYAEKGESKIIFLVGKSAAGWEELTHGSTGAGRYLYAAVTYFV